MISTHPHDSTVPAGILDRRLRRRGVETGTVCAVDAVDDYPACRSGVSIREIARRMADGIVGPDPAQCCVPMWLEHRETSTFLMSRDEELARGACVSMLPLHWLSLGFTGQSMTLNRGRYTLRFPSIALARNSCRGFGLIP